MITHIDGMPTPVKDKLIDVIRAKRPNAATMLFAGDEVERKVSITAMVPPELIEKANPG